jgi:hypothetical protein
MSNKVRVFQVPVPSTEFLEDAVLCGNIIRYEYIKSTEHIKSGIRFFNLKATRTRSQGACTAWHIEEAYDTLIEIEESDWVQEILIDGSDVQARYGVKWSLKHFMIYLDGCGCMEAVCESWSALPEEAGGWT